MHIYNITTLLIREQLQISQLGTCIKKNKKKKPRHTTPAHPDKELGSVIPRVPVEESIRLLLACFPEVPSTSFFNQSCLNHNILSLLLPTKNLQISQFSSEAIPTPQKSLNYY